MSEKELEIYEPELVKTTTALIKISPEADVEVKSFYAEALKLQLYAETRVITTIEDLLPASDDLLLIRRLKRTMEDKRKEYVKPLQDHVKTINDAFKTLMEPIEIADEVTEEKILAFTLKQKLIREEQEKINALRLEAAKKEMELKGELTESVNLVEVIPEAPKRVHTDIGTVGTMTTWKFEVIDFHILPDEYKLVDAAKLGKVVRAGLRSIPGVRIYSEDSLRGTTK